MKTATLTWVLPTVRESGNPLDIADINRAEVEMSADQGANWIPVNTVPADQPQTLTIPDLDIGTWFFRIRAVDHAERLGPWTELSDEVIDDSPPGAVTNASVSFA